jgi:hypothetical protein
MDGHAEQCRKRAEYCKEKAATKTDSSAKEAWLKVRQ